MLSLTSSLGMAQTQTQVHRVNALPQLGSQIGVRDPCSSATQSFRGQSNRSPPFLGNTLRRHFNSSQNSSNCYNLTAEKMDVGQYADRPRHDNSVPPLQPVQTLGTLQYVNQTPQVKIEISGTVDKGPFLSQDREWTCYRRNYLACNCSYALSPLFPSVPIQFVRAPPGSSTCSPQTYQVFGFAMCISAVVAENEQQNIELVQHTPKRDKGPTTRPLKIAMAPKSSNSLHHNQNPYADANAVLGTRGMYGDGMGVGGPGAGQQLPTEHTFERIQFKQATQNNGKRRAAQQYYHLIIELWADIGGQCNEKYVKVAYRKTAKMIVRGRSPGHYQNERRNSQGNGPGGSAGHLGGYPSMGPMDFNPGGMLSGAGTGGYATTYDGRGSIYGSGTRQHDLTDEALVSSEEVKVMDQVKTYPAYYSGPIYEGHQDRVDLFHQRSGGEASMANLSNGGGSSSSSSSKVKNEYEMHLLSRPFSSAPRANEPRHVDQYHGKSTTGGYCTSIMPSAGINMTMA